MYKHILTALACLLIGSSAMAQPPAQPETDCIRPAYTLEVSNITGHVDVSIYHGDDTKGNPDYDFWSRTGYAGYQPLNGPWVRIKDQPGTTGVVSLTPLLEFGENLISVRARRLPHTDNGLSMKVSLKKNGTEVAFIEVREEVNEMGMTHGTTFRALMPESCQTE